MPDDYAGCFAGLSRAGIIAASLSARLQQTARFRNLLVHGTVDYGRVFGVLENDLDDLHEFSRAIAALL